MKSPFTRPKFNVEAIKCNRTLKIKTGPTSLKSILVDPKLYGGKLDAPNTNPLRAEDVTKDKVCAIVISWATPEHCQLETLEKLDKSIKIIANAEVSIFCRELGFTDVVQINHGQSLLIGSIRVYAGSSIRPLS